MTKREFKLNRKRLIRDIKNRCQELNVTLVLTNKRHVRYPGFGKGIAGFFEEHSKTSPAKLVSTIKGKWGLSTLLHESSHMDQWIEDHKSWTQSNTEDGIFDEWLHGKKFKKERIKKAASLIRSCELDCEKRTVEKLKKYKIGIGTKKYIKDANCYLFLYTFLLKSRKWPKTLPMGIKEITDAMPDKFLDRYDRMPKKLEELYWKYCND